MNISLRRRCALLLMLWVLGGCAAPTTGNRPLATSPVPVAEHRGSDASDASDAPGAADMQTRTAPRQPTVLPASPSPVSTPTSGAGAPLPAIINVGEQAGAMLPDFAADVQAATLWNQYIITATLIPDTLTVVGEMRVLLRNREAVPFSELYFYLYPNHASVGGNVVVDNVLVNGESVTVRTEQEDVSLRVELNRPLAPGASAVVAMPFTARSRPNASGLAASTFNQQAGVWSLTNFYPVLARRLGGTWDRRLGDAQGDLAVTETALYDVYLDTPPDMTLVTTGVRISQEQLAHGPRRERFVSGPQRDFFLAAIQGLDQASSVVDGTRLVSYYQPGNRITGERSLAVAEQALRTFNARFGRYPLAELEVVQVSLRHFWGVEYPGVIVIDASLYRSGGRDLDTTVAHEVGHQWWYSLVGNDVQGEAWLDEGLTSYTQVVYYEGQGDRISAEGELRRFRNQYESARKTGQNAPLGQPVNAFRGNYFAIVYAKGALFFHALRVRLGDETFFRFLQNYYTTYRYDEATGTDLLRVAQETCGCDLQAFYAEWVHATADVAIP